ncbi:hypothetical protein G6F37_011068 [Rhizopus arrhizus]|nr:hypothetical protein G6F38_011153 [Rhizopus arrhizus]KAG1151064.1 hypothetical protein G6F37_011068 [Rhizopus arrhizus]
MFNKITLDDYDLEYSSDDFDAPVVKRPFLGESTKSAFRITKSTSAAVEPSTTASKTSLTFPSLSSLCPVPTDKASDIKEGPKKISKRVMTIKTTVKNIWKPVYLQPLYDLVHTTNLLVTHTFAFTKYIYFQELAANENFALNNYVTKDFFVEVFLSLVLSKGGNSTRLKDMTKTHRRLIPKYKEAYFEDAGYTPPNLPYAQQISLYECTKIQTAYYNNIKVHFGNRLRGLINKLFKKKEKAESLRGEMQANKSSSKAIKEATRKKIYRLCNQFVQYIKTRASVKNTLYEYYGNETTKSKETYFPESEFDFRVDQKCDLYYGNLFIARIRVFFSQPENCSTDSSVKSQLYATYLQQSSSTGKRDVQTTTAKQLQKTISTALEKLQLLPFRKLKFSSKLFFDQNDQKLVRSLKAKFGQDAVLVFGDWSAPNVKYQEPTRSKGLIRMLKKNGFVVYLINEYKTSSHCPTCEMN